MSRERRENLPRNQGQTGADGEGRERGAKSGGGHRYSSQIELSGTWSAGRPAVSGKYWRSSAEEWQNLVQDYRDDLGPRKNK